MTPFGSTRSRVCRDHALICPDSFVPSVLPGWYSARGVMLIAPAMGARFTQYLALLDEGGAAAPAAAGVERFVYVLDGVVETSAPNRVTRELGPGGFVFVPPGVELSINAKSEARLNVFEKRYVQRPGVEAPEPVRGQEQSVPGEPFQGDPDARLQVLLPDEPAFDLAVNVFSYQPGAALPQVEIHVMEHGLLMLAGAGVYRLGDDWYPVTAGDVIWMASYCPQWFVAMGKTPARYLYYKDVNRDPLGAEP